MFRLAVVELRGGVSFFVVIVGVRYGDKFCLGLGFFIKIGLDFF